MGPGTGKRTGVAMAVKVSKEKQVKRIIPNTPCKVEAGEIWSFTR
jgi:phosphate starvation-inducible protein PhoH